jgi:Cysteine-rich secretory protein family/Carboxypeptidase regulatory-like domain
VFAKLRRLLLERLEDRCTPATITTASVSLSAPEQLILQMINRARANPTAEATLDGIGLNDDLPAGTISSSPEQPLAPNADLQTVAEQHSADMIANNYFSHTAPDGSTPQTRIAATGYTGLDTGENIAYLTATNNAPDQAAPQLQTDLFESAEHRENVLSPNYNEIGVGLANQVLGANNYEQVDVTQDFGGRSNVVYLTGVLYNDTSHTGFYAIGEGLSGVTVTATNLTNGQSYATTSNSAGGYEIALPAGSYSVTILGVTGQVTIGSTNVEVDYQTDTLLGVTPGSLTTSAAPATATPKTPDQIGVFRNGTWILDTTHTEVYNSNDAVYSFGEPGDIPVVGDWNGNGKDEIGVFRNVNGVGEWILDTNGDGVYDAGDTVFTFGLGTDKPVVGDWNGDGKDEVGVFRNVNGVGQFILDTNGDQQYDATSTVFFFGLATDKVVIGDWNGDGKDEVGVFRNNGQGVGIFSLDTDGDHQFDANSTVFTFGLATDTVLIGDWNGDGKDKVGVFRNNGAGLGIWSLDYNGTLQFTPSDPVFIFGLATDIPVVGNW